MEKDHLCVSVLTQQYFSPDLFLELIYKVRHLGSLCFYPIPAMLCCIFHCWLLLAILPIFGLRVFQSPSKSLHIPVYLFAFCSLYCPFPLLINISDHKGCHYWILRYQLTCCCYVECSTVLKEGFLIASSLSVNFQVEVGLHCNNLWIICGDLVIGCLLCDYAF